MSTRHALPSAFDLERREQVQELCRAQQQRVHQRAAPPHRGPLSRPHWHRALPPPRLHLRRRRHLLRLGELVLPRRSLLLLHRISHHRLRRLRPHQLPHLQTKHRELQKRIHTNGRLLCLPCLRTHPHSYVLQSSPRRSRGQMLTTREQSRTLTSMTVREERLQLFRQSPQDVMIVVVRKFQSVAHGRFFFLILELYFVLSLYHK